MHLCNVEEGKELVVLKDIWGDDGGQFCSSHFGLRKVS